jgi:acetyl-CoA carboxylase biotin carboxyl carrier protein
MDIDQIAALLKLLKEHEVSEFKYSDDAIQLDVRVGHPPAVAVAAPVMAHAPVLAAAPAPAVASAPPPEAGLVVVESPMVGTFYASPSPGAAPFVEVGQRVSAGQTLCIIEAMKLMNQIEAEVSGVLAARLVQDGQPVEFGQPMFKIRPA